MSNVFTLDSMREEVEREFAPVTIDLGKGSVVLRHVLRIPKLRRDEVFGLITELETIGNSVDEESDEPQQESFEDTDKMGDIALRLIGLVADDDKLGEVLVSQLEDDLALTLKVFEAWMSATQPGEADSSPA